MSNRTSPGLRDGCQTISTIKYSSDKIPGRSDAGSTASNTRWDISVKLAFFFLFLGIPFKLLVYVVPLRPSFPILKYVVNVF